MAHVRVQTSLWAPGRKSQIVDGASFTAGCRRLDRRSGAGPPQSQREQPPLAKKEEEELTGSGSFSFHQGKKAQELILTVGKGGRIASSALFSSDGPGRTSLWAGLF